MLLNHAHAWHGGAFKKCPGVKEGVWGLKFGPNDKRYEKNFEWL